MTPPHPSPHPTVTDTPRTDYLAEAQRGFRAYKKLGDSALAPLRDEDLAFAPDPESNSIAVIVKHLHGNMRSRWTDFLTSDGEKPDRNRDTEFEVDAVPSREQVMRWWEDGWRYVFDALAELRTEDLDRTILLRDEPHSVMQAISRQLMHYAYHVGQIVYVAKHRRGEAWTSLSVPKGESEAWTAATRARNRAKYGD